MSHKARIKNTLKQMKKHCRWNGIKQKPGEENKKMVNYQMEQIKKDKLIADQQKDPIWLDYANGWKETPEIVKKCRELKHNSSDIDVGTPHRGYQHNVRCVICNYFYKYDSSD